MKTDEQYSGLKIKWRRHEMILATAITAILIISYVWNIFHFSTESINNQYANVFQEMHVPFNLYRNVILPYVTVVLAIYLAYLALNLFTISRLLSPKKFGARTVKPLVSLSK